MNKVVIITGADGDIGRSIAQQLASFQYHLILIDRRYRDLDWIQELQSQGATTERVEIDLTASAEIEAFFRELEQRQVKLWALVNNAGIYPVVRLSDYTLELWNEVMTVNLTSAFWCSKLAAPLLEMNGAIVNISSTGAHLGSRDPGYAASKAGMIGLTKSVARNLGPMKIRVNAVAPGMINTQMSKRMQPDDKLDNISRTVLGREGEASDVASVVKFLISDEAKYLTGTTIDVNGGLYIR